MSRRNNNPLSKAHFDFFDYMERIVARQEAILDDTQLCDRQRSDRIDALGRKAHRLLGDKLVVGAEVCAAAEILSGSWMAVNRDGRIGFEPPVFETPDDEIYLRHHGIAVRESVLPLGGLATLTSIRLAHRLQVEGGSVRAGDGPEIFDLCAFLPIEYSPKLELIAER